MTITSFFALAPPEDVWRQWLFVHKILFMCLVGYALTTTPKRVNQLIWAVVLPVGFWGVKGAISFPLHGGGKGIHDGSCSTADFSASCCCLWCSTCGKSPETEMSVAA